MKVLSNLSLKLTQLLDFTGVALLLLALAIGFFEVASRYLFSRSHGWIEEIDRMFIDFMVFLLVGSLIRSGAHLKIDVILMLFKGKLNLIVNLINDVMVFALCAFITVAGINMIRQVKDLGLRSATELEFPIWIYGLSVGIGMAIATLYSLEVIVKRIQSLRGGGQ